MMGKQGKHSKENPKRGAKKAQDSTSPDDTEGAKPKDEEMTQSRKVTSTVNVDGDPTTDFPGVY